MTVRVGINGFGRIGRNYIRALNERSGSALPIGHALHALAEKLSGGAEKGGISGGSGLGMMTVT